VMRRIWAIMIHASADAMDLSTSLANLDLLRKSGEAFSDQAASLSNCAGLR
jgi:hypothetical protein